MSTTGGQAWLDRFPVMGSLSPGLRNALVRTAREVRLPAGAIAFSSGQSADDYLLIVEGTVKVRQTSERGREIVLYRITGGDSCILTSACLLAHAQYMAEGIAETDVRLVKVPEPTFERLMAESAVFRDFVLSTYASRILELLLLVEEVAFTAIGQRLAQRLLELAGAGEAVNGTHQDLAVELGTAREVVSRQLKEFERRGWVRTERGRVLLLDRPALTEMAKQSERAQ